MTICGLKWKNLAPWRNYTLKNENYKRKLWFRIATVFVGGGGGRGAKILGFISLVSLGKMSKDCVDKILFLDLKLLKGLQT